MESMHYTHIVEYVFIFSSLYNSISHCAVHFERWSYSYWFKFLGSNHFDFCHNHRYVIDWVSYMLVLLIEPRFTLDSTECLVDAAWTASALAWIYRISEWLNDTVEYLHLGGNIEVRMPWLHHGVKTSLGARWPSSSDGAQIT